MKGWIDLCSDVNWVDFHGMWCKKAPDGSWYIIRWTNMVEGCGMEEYADRPYDCDVLRVDLKEVPEREIESAMKCVGIDEEDMKDSTEESREQQLVYACVAYGISAPLDSFGGSKWPERIRAQARRRAEELMRDQTKLDERLDRPVNKIGSTARDFGRGDSLAGLRRYEEEGQHGTDPTKDLMLKIHGGSVAHK